jgi:hypothetical protein
VAHKTGSTERVRNAAGIVLLLDSAVAIWVLTADNEDTRSDADNAGSLLAQLRQSMTQTGFGDVEEATVEFVSSITDVAPYRARAFSCLQLIADDAF